MENLKRNKINVLLWGFGFMNKLIMRYVLEKGYSIAGVITRSNIGEDPFKLADLEKYRKEDQEIKISSYLNAQEALNNMKEKPDVCILSTKSLLKEISEELKILAKNKINVVTMAEELFYSYDSSPELTKEIDQIFKENNVTVVATGFQDYFIGNLGACLINSSQKVEKITITTRYNADLFGSNGQMAYGQTKEEFYEHYKTNPDPINTSGNPWLASLFNWKIVKQTHRYIPILLKLEDFDSMVHGKIKKECVIGEITEVTTLCENGVSIVNALEGLIFHSNEDKEMISWKVEGEPSFELICNNPSTAEITCASTVNRIINVLESKEKGYIPTYKFGLHISQSK